MAQLFLDDPQHAATLSIAELAIGAGTSTTSVVRFAKAVGYQRFRDLGLDLTREAAREDAQIAEQFAVSGDISRDDTLADVIAKVARSETLSIADTAATLDPEALGRAVALIAAARRTDSFGLGASSQVGHDLQTKLTRIGRTALNWSDEHSAWTAAITLDASCVALAVSHSGQTAATVDYLTIAREAGAATIAITNFATSPVAAAADVVLTTAARENPIRVGALSSRMAQLMVVDCLFIGVAQSSYEESVAALHATYDVVRRSPSPHRHADAKVGSESGRRHSSPSS